MIPNQDDIVLSVGQPVDVLRCAKLVDYRLLKRYLRYAEIEHHKVGRIESLAPKPGAIGVPAIGAYAPVLLNHR